MSDIEKREPILQQLDQVELLTTRRVDYLSARPGSAPSPHGIWSVIGIIGGKALLAKEGALIRIPLNDIRKISNYSVGDILAKLRSRMYDRSRQKDQKAAEEGSGDGPTSGGDS